MTEQAPDTQQYHLGWNMMGAEQHGLVDYCLIPVDHGPVGTRLLCKRVREDGSPRPDYWVSRSHLAALRSSVTAAGAIDNQERVLVATLKASAARHGHDLPDIVPTTKRPRWDHYNDR